MALAGGLLLGVCASSDVANTPSTTATTSQATTESVSTSATTGSTTASGTILGTEVAADAFLATLSEEQRERVAYAPATRRKHVLVELAG